MSEPPLLAPNAPAAVLRRLHPLTPVVRGWKLLAGFAVFGTSRAMEDLSSGDVGRPSGGALAGLGGIVAIVVVLGVFFGWLSWRFTAYGVDGGDLRIETGVLFRKSRRVRLDRLQAVDIVRPLLARLLGLAELRLEVAGGASTEAPLAYVSIDDAHRLRAELLALAAGLDEGTPEAAERELYAVPDGRLLASTALQLPVVLSFVAAIGFTVVSVAGGAGASSLFVLVSSVGAFATAFVRQFMANQGFRLAESPDGLRISRGLLETRAQTVPPGRIQAVRLVEPVLWRAVTGWARLEVAVAGYSTSGQAGEASAVLLPVAPRADCIALMSLVLPGADIARIPATGVPSRARWLAPLSRHLLAAGGDERYFLSVRGAVRRETDVMPHERIQSVRAHQGPLQRRLRLATVTLDTTPGPVTVVAQHRDADEAWQMAQRQADRARHARSLDDTDQWMRPR